LHVPTIYVVEACSSAAPNESSAAAITKTNTSLPRIRDILVLLRKKIYKLRTAFLNR
jgi:hypothetical protein